MAKEQKKVDTMDSLREDKGRLEKEVWLYKNLEPSAQKACEKLIERNKELLAKISEGKEVISCLLISYKSPTIGNKIYIDMATAYLKDDV